VRISQTQLFGLFQLIDGVVRGVETVQQLIVQAPLLQVQLGQLVAAVLVPKIEGRKKSEKIKGVNKRRERTRKFASQDHWL
jgi:hypothetical protein